MANDATRRLSVGRAVHAGLRARRLECYAIWSSNRLVLQEVDAPPWYEVIVKVESAHTHRVNIRPRIVSASAHTFSAQRP